MSIKIVVGVTTFRSAHADSNALWKVVRKSGPESYVCKIVDEPFEIDGKKYSIDWAGTEKAFLTRDIHFALEMEVRFDTLLNDHQKFYASLKTGQIVHYHNGFGNYVRCSVVVDQNNKRSLKAIALVGSWASHDLNSRRLNGEINEGYYPKKIREGESFEPHYTNIYETGLVKQPDPTNMVPIDLNVPEMTLEEAEQAKRWKKIEKIHEITKNHHGDPKVILLEVAKSL